MSASAIPHPESSTGEASVMVAQHHVQRPLLLSDMVNQVTRPKKLGLKRKQQHVPEKKRRDFVAELDKDVSSNRKKNEKLLQGLQFSDVGLSPDITCADLLLEAMKPEPELSIDPLCGLLDSRDDSTESPSPMGQGEAVVLEAETSNTNNALAFDSAGNIVAYVPRDVAGQDNSLGGFQGLHAGESGFQLAKPYDFAYSRKKNAVWSKTDVATFYIALARYGPDVTLIQTELPEKTLEQIKNRYVAEEKRSPHKIDQALKQNRRPLTCEEFEIKHGAIDGDVLTESRIALGQSSA